MIRFGIAFFQVVISLVVITDALHCLNEHGRSVSWWFIYKHNDGMSYFYFDESSTINKLTLLKDGDFSHPESSIGRTLQQVYSNQDSINFIAYNDETPQPTSSNKQASSGHSGTKLSGDTYGHAKGVFAFDINKQTHSVSGYWLIHSIPKFPDLTAKNYYYDASEIYGQSLLCISFNTYDEIQRISEQLTYIEPNIYKYNTHNIDTSIDPKTSEKIATNPKLRTFLTLIDTKNRHKYRIYNGYGYQWIESVAFTKFLHFAKSKKWDHDIYESLISPTVHQSFAWETWRRNPSEPSYCKKKLVTGLTGYTSIAWDELNVGTVLFYDASGNEKELKSTQDHSKLGISRVSKKLSVDCGKTRTKCKQIDMKQQGELYSQIKSKLVIFPSSKHCNVTESSSDGCESEIEQARVDGLELETLGKLESASHELGGSSSIESSNFWVCVGDINRMSSQMHRGGGSACFINYRLWSILNSAFVDIEQC